MNKSLFTLICAGMMCSSMLGFSLVDTRPVQAQPQVQMQDQTGKMFDRNMNNDTFNRDNLNQRDGNLRINVNQDRGFGGNPVVRDGTVVKEGVIVRDRADGPVLIRVREFFHKDPAFKNLGDKVDFTECNGSVVIFGVVDSEKVKSDIAARIKTMEGVTNVQNKLIVK